MCQLNEIRGHGGKELVSEGIGASEPRRAESPQQRALLSWREWVRGAVRLASIGATCLVLVASVAWGSGGMLLWEDQLDPTGNADQARAIAVAGARTFVAGIGVDARLNSIFLVRAYDAKIGSLIWEDQFVTAGHDLGARAITAGGGGVFAAGLGVDDSRLSDFLVRAYDAMTGTLLWEDQVNKSGRDDQALAIAAHGKGVFAAGFAGAAGLVRAYAAKTGNLLWEDQFETGEISTEIDAIGVSGPRVFAAGFALNGAPNFDRDWLVRAYDASTGLVLWEDRLDSAGGEDRALAIAALGERVFVAGSTVVAKLRGFLVRAYNAKTGALLWEDRGSRAGDAAAITAKGGAVFAAGTNGDFLVRAYDAKSGTLLWEDRFDETGGNDQALAIAVGGHRVFAAGTVQNGSPNFDADFVVRAYEADSGVLVWEDQASKAGGSDVALAIGVGGPRVFAAGIGGDAPFDNDFLVRAYDAK